MNAKITGKLSFFEQVAAGIHGAIITLFDDETYEPGRCSNGGHYGFSTKFTLKKGGWKVEYSSTGEFSTCPHCGDYNSHNGFHDNCRSHYWTSSELADHLNSLDWDKECVFLEGQKAYSLSFEN